jgi:hypothetical protein
VHEVEGLLIELQRSAGEGETIALGLTLKDGVPLFAVLVVRKNQVVDVLATGNTPEAACRAALQRPAASPLH